MSWGTELWDQYDNLSIHSQKGIDFLEKFGHFMKDRCQIEIEYAGKLRKLVKGYQPKKKEEDDYQYTSCKAFRIMMDEINDLAGQHEVVAENLSGNVIRDITLLTKELKDERKKQLNEGAKLSQNLQTQKDSLERARRNYEKAFREAERALDNYQKVEADYNLSRAEVEKQRINMAMKSQQCEEAKKDYANQLQKTNDLQRSHFNLLLPDVFRQLQELDEKRIRNIKHFIHNSAEIERKVFPIISKCIDGVVRAGDLINEKEDAQLVIERYKSGFLPHGDYPFEDLSKTGGSGMRGDSIDGPRGGSDPSLHHLSHQHTVKGTMSGGKMKKRVGLFTIFSSNKNNVSMDAKEDYGELPPNQRRKKLAAKVTELKRQVTQEQAAMDALMKMKSVYEANPALGDPMTVEGQLNESSHKLEKYKVELERYTSWLEAAQNSPGLVGNGGSNANSANVSVSSVKLNGGVHRHSVGSNEESLSRSASDSSVSAPARKNSISNTAQANHGSGGSPESGLGTSHNSLGTGAATIAMPEDSGIADASDENEFYTEEPLQPLGTCRALYPFEATSEGSMGMSEGEELLIMEQDQGDGWTRVRRTHSPQEGFVPTTYIQCTLYST